MAFFFIAPFAAFAFYHEAAHGAIYENYGWSNVSYGVNWIGAYTVGSCQGNMDCEYLHSLNEIIGYHLTTVYIFVLCMLMGILYALANLNNSGGKNGYTDDEYE